MNRLRTPEEVAEDLGAISPSTIRTLIRSGKIEYTRLARGKFGLTDAQVEDMLKFLRVVPVWPRVDHDARADSLFPATERSRAIHRSRASRRT
ncbi:excisionase family DNA binding protein [Arthrobacter bambusae]|nr:excisionase family DNA binding protein [Arthrobacter bambusae]MDQ0237078.1 excisionase family DNA binding protein [Arthrobacter bambusae]